MSWSHLRATLWLRWRLLANRVRRASKLGSALFGVLLVLGLAVSAGAFLLATRLGLELLPDAEPFPLMVAWIALSLAFLFAWTIGLLTDLQRSDAMSFKNLQHLPVPLHWVFLYNYLSSYVSVSVALFLPAMLGLWLATVLVEGPSRLLTLPLLLATFAMVTALTYQLRGWLARVMEDKRRGRNVIAAVTVGFVLLLQVPNLINLGTQPSRSRARAEERELVRAASEEGPGQAEARAELARHYEEAAQQDAAIDGRVSLGAQVVPLGWLAYGMRAVHEGRWLPAALGTLGLAAIAAASLRRTYRKTLASIVGAGSSAADVAPEPAQAAPSAAAPERAARPTLLVERSLPVVGEDAAGIALGSLRSLLRSPEAKLLLLSPVILLGLFGLLLVQNPDRDGLAPFAPMLGLGAIAMGLLSIVQLIQNQFGTDRHGFRAFVLSPAPRHRILLGKNLSTAPLGIGTGLVALAGLQVLVPADGWHLLGAFVQAFSGYLLVCMIGNTTSILAPVRLKDHGLKAANASLKTVLLQLFSLLLVPLALAPLLVPTALEFLLRGEPWARALPLHPLLNALGLLGLVPLYGWLLRRQGELLQDREQHVLDVLTRE